MDGKLFIGAIIRFIAGAAIVGALLFVPAGTIRYPQAWLLLIILFIPMFIAGIVMMMKSPDLLRKRLNLKERQSEQKEVVAFSAVMFISAFVLAGLNFRFGWMVLPEWSAYAAAAVFLLGYVLYAEVLRENQYLSRTIEVQEGQHVVDTGMYGIVRHPMYMCTLLMFLSMPIILGSPVSFLVTLLYIPIIIKRIHNEEKVLEEGLPGYTEYEKKVTKRLVPLVW